MQCCGIPVMLRHSRDKLPMRSIVAMVNASVTPFKYRSSVRARSTSTGISRFGAKRASSRLAVVSDTCWIREPAGIIQSYVPWGPLVVPAPVTRKTRSSSVLLTVARSTQSVSCTNARMKSNPWRIRPTLHDPTGAPRNAQAIVVLLGWWGAQPRHLDKFAELYQEILPSAAIVAGTASSQSILLKRDDQLKDFAKQGLEAIANTLADYENLHLPIFIHVFSNGGGFVWHQMLRILDEEEELDDGPLPNYQQCSTHATHYRHNLSNTSIDTEETPLHTNTALSLMRNNIRGQIYDSAPAYPKFNTGIAALEASGMVQNRFLLLIVKCCFSLLYLFESLWDRINNRPHRLVEYWDDLLQCDWTIPQGFIYSTIDRMVDSDHLEDFIQTRTRLLQQEDPDTTPKISILKFDDTPHVMHYRYHPQEYKEFVTQFLENHMLPIPNRSTK